MSAAASGMSGGSAAMVTGMASTRQRSFAARMCLRLGHERPPCPVAGEVVRGQPYESESTNEHDDADVEECQSPAEEGHATGPVENPADHDWPDEATRVTGHRVKRQGGASARRICAARGPGSQRGGVEPDQESIDEDQD